MKIIIGIIILKSMHYYQFEPTFQAKHFSEKNNCVIGLKPCHFPNEHKSIWTVSGGLMLVEHVHSVRSIYSTINCGYSSRTAFICTTKNILYSLGKFQASTWKSTCFYPIILYIFKCGLNV